MVGSSLVMCPQLLGMQLDQTWAVRSPWRLALFPSPLHIPTTYIKNGEDMVDWSDS